MTSEEIREELYDLDADPGETRNLATEESEILLELRGRLREWIEEQEATAAPVPDRELTPAEIKRLESLGYLG